MTRDKYSAFCTVLPEAIDKFAAFGEIVRNCSVFDVLSDRHAFLDSVIRREKLQSTGIGHGVAIAHGKVVDLDRTRIAIGLSRDGIRFDDIFEEPVHLVFLIASCPKRQSEYVKALSSILSWVHEGNLGDELLSGHTDSPLAKAFIEMMAKQDFHPPVAGGTTPSV